MTYRGLQHTPRNCIIHANTSKKLVPYGTLGMQMMSKMAQGTDLKYRKHE